MTLTTPWTKAGRPVERARRARAEVAMLPLLLWTLVHAAVYFVLLVAGSIVLQFVDSPADPFLTRLVFGFAGALWISILLLPCVIVMLLVLQLLRGLAWPWFRLAALILLAPPTLLVYESGNMWALLVVHALLALIVVKPAV
ncbi:hypothetical protein JIG36_17460 [Actinoplanes sp. LDG1-06]|uniref:Uncharacterized protein n=1 Tax=Paractinoplanes ovalisporus TaxID=2810368 RepID=A0ABS2AC34_9ACTN|nr:hypothetical protein [Actinoplanes ovalisporus]MBM2617345.1 hypothetical protein [Actinoplanes ovalisporus]